MEAVPRLPMISFPARTSIDAPELGEQLKKYIRNHYHEDPESYNGEIYELESLRRGAINASTDFIGCSTLKKYFCQLKYLTSRFPFDDSAVKVSFNWFSAFDQSCSNSGDVLFEMDSILYNIASLHTVLGTLDERTTADGMKISCTHFQCASWAFQVLSQNSKGDSELNPLLLNFMTNFSLSQAQECILEKSMTDNRKPNIIAKVSMQVVEYLRLTLKNLESFKKSNGYAVDLVGSKLIKMWQRHCEFKIAYYYAVTYFHQGLHSEELQKMGERLAYFQGAVEKLNEATKISKSLDKAKQISEALVFANDVISGKLTAGQKENEFVYHEKVPSLATLPEVKGASLVKGIPFVFTDPEIAGPDIFNRLVPMEAHQASSLYSEEKAKLLRRIISQISEKNEELDTYLASMQLDSLTVTDNLDALPQELVECCADLNSRDAMKELTGIMGNINHVYYEIKAKISELLTLIKEEEEKEKEYAVVMRTKKVPNQLLIEHKREALKYKEAHEAAQANNQALHTAIMQHRDNITLLSRPLNQLVGTLPSVAGVENETDRLTRLEVQRLLNKVGEMQIQRRDFEEQLRKNIHEDDITKQLVTSHENMDILFNEQLSKHNVVVNLLEQNMAAQSNILQALSEANASYGSTRRLINKVKSQRSDVITSLIGSYNTFISITCKAQDADEFYSKLEVQVNKLHSKIKSLCKVTDEEREEKLALKVKKYGGTSAELSFGNRHTLDSSAKETVTGPKLKDFLQAGSGMKTQNILPESNPSVLPPSEMGYHYSFANDSAGGPGYLPDLGNLRYGNNSAGLSLTGERGKDEKASGDMSSYTQPLASSSYYTPSAPSEAVQRYLNASPYYTDGIKVSSPSTTYNSNASDTFSTSQSVSTCTDVSNPCYSFESYSSQSLRPSYPYVSSDTIHSASTVSSSNYASGVPHSAIPNANYKNYPDYHSSPSYGHYTAQPYQSAVTAQLNSNVTPVSSSASVSATSLPYGDQYHSDITGIGSQSSLNNASYHPGNLFSQAGLYNTTSNYSSVSYGSPYSQISSPASISSNTIVKSKFPIPTITTASIEVPYTTPRVAGQSFSMWTSTPPYYAGQSYTGNLTSTTNSLGHEVDGNVQTDNQTINVQDKNSSTANNYNQYYYANPYSQNTKAVENTASDQTANVSEAHQYYSQGPYGNYGQAHITGSYGIYANLPVSTNGGVGNFNQSGVKDPNQIESSSIYSHNQYYDKNRDTSYSSCQSQNTVEKSVLCNQGQPAGYFSQTYHPPTNSILSSQPYTLPPCKLQEDRSSPLTPVPSVSSVGNPITNSLEKGVSNIDLLAGIELTSKSSPLMPKVMSCKSSQPQVTHTVDGTLSDLTSSGGTWKITEENLENNLNFPNKIIQDQSSIKDSSVTAIIDLTKLAKQSSRSTSVLDPLSSDETLFALATETGRFSKFVQGLDKKSLNGPTNLEIKWKELIDILEVRCSTLKVSIGRCYPLSNRFPDNLPFDFNRVKLPSARDDYINASFVQLKSVEESIPLILTQAPMTNTTPDFWTMVWENQVEIIVCMNTEAEVKGHSYYPKESCESIEFGHFTISLKQVRHAANDCWKQRTFLLYHNGQKASKVILHAQFLTWPPSAMPESPGPLLQFVNEVLNLQKQQRNKLNPVVVHCVSGSGRSGVFAVLSSFIKFLQTTGCLADVWNLVIELCQERRLGILDRWHLMFLYSSTLYYAQEVLMKRGILTDKATFEEGPREKTHVRHPSADLLSSDLNRIKAKLGLESDNHNDANLSRSGSQSSIISGSSGGGMHSATVSENPTPPPSVVASSPSPTHSVLSDGKLTKIGSANLPPNLAASLDPDMLVLEAPNPPKAKKITKESFFIPSSNIGQRDKVENDPFSELDPMWNLKKH